MPNDLASFLDSACVGAIEGGPRCADSSWSLWRGFQGNDFCCQVGLIGIYQSSGKVAGTCVASGQAGTATTAQLVSSSNNPSIKLQLLATHADTLYRCQRELDPLQAALPQQPLLQPPHTLQA